MSSHSGLADNFSEKYGPWALIAGASHGVGMEFARQVAAEGINCVLLSRREATLKAFQAELERDHGIETRVIAADLSKDGAVDTIEAGVRDLDLGLIIYNAGAPPYASEFLKAPLEPWEDLVRLNVTTVTQLCHRLGGRLVERGRGGLLLVGSQAGLGGNKKYAMYTGTKAFMLNFGESLWIEWKDRGVDVLNLLISVVDSPTLRAQMKKSNIAGWDAEDIGVPKPVDMARIGLRELPHGPTFIHPEDEATPAGEVTAGARRRDAMLERWAITAPFVGDD
ncbi:MAG TPA: SDR family NAD(P)-dependent oxidoreductase [Porticoccaceae bacterium]|nr:SDR family NAD(P)-dependent oxidoreductase [Porticoccaceae bacterium]